ncbi:MAG: SMC-Scp complex subunit ScpB, partial [Firmicutes bacterium]|nr:SMC-Scp complex subunit ScpB [Bacillota bacterium]
MNLKAVVEGLLFISGEEGITIAEMTEIIEKPFEEVKALLKELALDYQKEDRGIHIIELE